LSGIGISSTYFIMHLLYTIWTFCLMALFLEVQISPYGFSDLVQTIGVKDLQMLYFPSCLFVFLTLITAFAMYIYICVYSWLPARCT
jgi:hypothetical protein